MFSPASSLIRDMPGDGRPRAAKSFGEGWQGKEAWGCQGKVWVGVFSPTDSFAWALAEGFAPGPRCEMARVFVCHVFQQKPSGADKTLHIKTNALYESK